APLSLSAPAGLVSQRTRRPSGSPVNRGSNLVSVSSRGLRDGRRGGAAYVRDEAERSGARGGSAPVVVALPECSRIRLTRATVRATSPSVVRQLQTEMRMARVPRQVVPPHQASPEA